jgi:hypothetical protein
VRQKPWNGLCPAGPDNVGLDDHIWGMKITALEESADFTTIDTEKMFSKLKFHELSSEGLSNYNTSLTSKSFVTSTRVGGHVANPTNTTDSFVLEFALSSLTAASDEQYKSSPMTRSSYWQESSAPCLGSTRRGGDHRGAVLSAATAPTSSSTAPSGRSLTPTPTSTTTTTGMTPVTSARARRSTASETTRRSSRR